LHARMLASWFLCALGLGGRLWGHKSGSFALLDRSSGQIRGIPGILAPPLHLSSPEHYSSANSFHLYSGSLTAQRANARSKTPPPLSHSTLATYRSISVSVIRLRALAESPPFVVE
jgi:hypothetical protein